MGTRQLEIGSYFEQRFQHEAALEHAWVRNCESRCVEYQIPEQKNVDIDDAWTARNRANAAHTAQFALNALQYIQQLQWEVARIRAHDHVQEPGLIRDVLRFRFINRRSGNDVDLMLLKEFESAVQRLLTVSGIRA